MFPIIEKFLSIDGEGPTAGYLAAFIRFQGCNLRCHWCDTTYSFSADNVRSHETAEALYQFVKETGAHYVTLTGGEPLIQREIGTLLSLLQEDEALETHIETNGSVDIAPFQQSFPRISFIVDYKLNGSGMTEQMHQNNLAVIRKTDAYKFVIAGKEDLYQAEKVLRENDLCEKTQVFFSPVLGKMDPADMVEFLKAEKLDRVRLQLQLHKIIWHPDAKGV
ncbi:MAG: putative 7-carboxy-7-deazaguanine synthase QueE [Oscillospiraceae bacterium]|nr:putative 7-carboxy-7-deazaguanine synthase QueE [Oscillospiraceae bacterium]